MIMLNYVDVTTPRVLEQYETCVVPRPRFLHLPKLHCTAETLGSRPILVKINQPGERERGACVQMELPL